MTGLTHEVARDLASARVDGELGVDDIRRLDAHLSACPACAAHDAALRDLSSLVRQLPRTSPRAGLAEATIRRLPARRVPRGWSWRPMQVVTVVAMAVVLAVVAGIALRPGTPLVPFATVPAAAEAAQLSRISTLYAERTVVTTPQGDPARRVTVEERIWWVAPDRLRVERVEADAGGTSTATTIVRRSDQQYVEVDGRGERRTVAPGLASVPEPLSAGITVLGRPTGPGPVVAGRPTTRYELEVEGARRVALVDAERYAVLAGEESVVLSKEVVVGTLVVESRQTRVLRLDQPIDDARFEIPRDAEVVPGGFDRRPVGDLSIEPLAAPEGLELVASGGEPAGRETLLFQRGAFQVLITSHLPDQTGPVAVRPTTVGGRPGVLRIPLYGPPSVTFTPGSIAVTVTVTALLAPHALTALAADMYLQPE
ncbi:MAG TPA: zf-HC2 domain-containing protein [Mycobacteriales bacterium]|nr:zf-HC2 domain-containing protein [Mycobacteriales bacterium]